MKLTYAIGVCNEHKELTSLLNFLIKTKELTDDINILVDTKKVTDEVRKVLEKYQKVISVHERDFCGDFSAHRNFHITKCSGDYIFMIDADEIPQEHLIKTIKNYCGKSDLIFVPRINVCPGYTEHWLKECKFTLNEVGWINWPDYQGRIFKNDSSIRWGKSLHEQVQGAKNPMGLEQTPKNALWHIKSVEVQDTASRFYESIS